MHLNIVKSKNAQQFYILEGYRNANGKCTTRIVKKLGTYEQLAKEHDDPVAWAKSVVDEMNLQAKECFWLPNRLSDSSGSSEGKPV